MKTEREIREEIDRLMNKLSYVKRHSFVIGGGAEAESIECSIDALLWVIGDRSGKPI